MTKSHLQSALKSVQQVYCRKVRFSSSVLQNFTDSLLARVCVLEIKDLSESKSGFAVRFFVRVSVHVYALFLVHFQRTLSLEHFCAAHFGFPAPKERLTHVSADEHSHALCASLCSISEHSVERCRSCST